jgi:AcrR family transcriptional regulator
VTETGTGRRRGHDGYDPQRTRAQLVASALTLFEAHGFHHSSLQEIVQDAHLTKGAFYHHFESKEDLLWKIQDEYMDHQMEAATAIVAEVKEPLEQVRALVLLSLEGVVKHRAHVAIVQQERRHLTGERLAAITRKRDAAEALLRGAVQAGIDAGQLRRDVSARIATFGILGMCTYAFQWYSADGSLGVEDIAEQFCDLILKGLAVE